MIRRVRRPTPFGGSRSRSIFAFKSPRRPKLVIACFSLPNRCFHYFNEIIGYRAAAEALGLTPIVLAPRDIDPSLAGPLAAKTVLDPLPQIGAGDAQTIVNQLTEILDFTYRLQSPWRAIEAENLNEADIILFHVAHPVLVQGAGLWLASRRPRQRPSVFYRFVGEELVDRVTGKVSGAAALYRAASKDLSTRNGQERVFFLANTSLMLRRVARVSDRRTFLMPLPKHYGDISTLPAPPRLPTAYLHFNYRSGRLTDVASDIIRRVKSIHPSTRFLVKFALGCILKGTIDRDIAADVELLPPEQEAQDYLSNFARSSVVVLPYERSRSLPSTPVSSPRPRASAGRS